MGIGFIKDLLFIVTYNSQLAIVDHYLMVGYEAYMWAYETCMPIFISCSSS